MRKTKLWKKLSAFKNRIFNSGHFKTSTDYWIKRYRTGGNSGAGSYNKNAEFKARVINGFIDKNNIQSVIEFGCGDGNQLKYSNYKSYVGFDISADALELCRKIHQSDKTKTFKLIGDYSNERAELTLSLDVIFHLVEDEIYFDYMKRLFDSSKRYVIIFSSNTNDSRGYAEHVRHHRFTDWVAQHRPDFKLIEIVENELKALDQDKGQRHFYADFYLYEKKVI